MGDCPRGGQIGKDDLIRRAYYVKYLYLAGNVYVIKQRDESLNNQHVLRNSLYYLNRNYMELLYTKVIYAQSYRIISYRENYVGWGSKFKMIQNVKNNVKYMKMHGLHWNSSGKLCFLYRNTSLRQWHSVYHVCIFTEFDILVMNCDWFWFRTYISCYSNQHDMPTTVDITARSIIRPLLLAELNKTFFCNVRRDVSISSIL